MGDIGDYWNEAKEYRRKHGAVSKQYWSEKQREQGTAFKHATNQEDDEYELGKLTDLGLSPILKNTHSFQVTIKGRQAMYYCGKNEKIIFKDGEKVDLGYKTLRQYLKEIN